LMQPRAHFVISLTIAIAAAIISPSPATYAAEFRHQNWGQWSGGAYNNDQTRQFSHCAAGVPYRSGVFMMVSINRLFVWSLGFADPEWNLTPGQGISVDISFDGGPAWNGMATALRKDLVSIPMDVNSALISAFRGSTRMIAQAQGQTFVFNLDGTSRLMPGLVQCVQTELAVERGEPPPALAKTPTPIKPAPLRPSAPQQPSADLELAATRIASNLLLQAQLPNARLLSKAETPEAIQRLGVAWKSDAGMGAVELLAPTAARDPQQLASQLITADAAACKGDFASGRSSELIDNTVVAKAFTGCKTSSGSAAFRYFILHNEGSGYVVFALTAGNTEQQSSSPLSDTLFAPAAIKAAFGQ
jgi:hypothetical protein